MGHDISIPETMEDKNSWYNIKKFKIGNTDFRKPEKALDSRTIKQQTYDEMKLKDTLKFSEASRIVLSFDEIDRILDEEDNSKINDFFHKKSWLASVPNILSLTFDFNPLKSVKKVEDMSGFFDLYYQYARLFVSVPNVRWRKVHTQPYRAEKIIDNNGYIKFVDETYSLLNTKNNKPIFVPISLKMQLKSIDTLIAHYLKKEYYYYWIDFEGASVSEITIGRMNHVFRLIKNSGYYNKTICHLTNMKREIISNSKDTTSPASDVLSSFAGANIVGINREPRKNLKNAKLRNLPPKEHKARLLDANTYYYVQTSNRALFSKFEYVPHNALRLQREFDAQAAYFDKHNSLDALLETKDMLTKYNDKAILRSLAAKAPSRSGQSTLF